MMKTNTVITDLYVGNSTHEGTKENMEDIAPVGHSMNSTLTLSSKSKICSFIKWVILEIMSVACDKISVCSIVYSQELWAVT